MPADPEPIGPAAILPAAILPASILARAIDAAVEAGHLVAAEFARPDGPRFSDNVTAPLDREIEMLLRDRLLALVPARFVGEEAGVLEAPDSPLANGYCWVVDPHDGTRAFLEGKRGSAVSVALLRQGIPILAVVYAPTSPDRGPDLIAWAEGGPITRDGVPVTIDLRERDLAAGDVVFLNHGAWQRPVWHGGACAPAGFMPLPSIAYRLARIAVGDGIATLTLRPVNALDIAAGHALLMAAGGVLLAEDGTPGDLQRPGRKPAVGVFRRRAQSGGGIARAHLARQPGTAAGASGDADLATLGAGGDVGSRRRLSVRPRDRRRPWAGNRAGGDRRARVCWAIPPTTAPPWTPRCAIGRTAGGDLAATSPFARAIPIGIWAFDPDMAAAAAGLTRRRSRVAPTSRP